MVHWNIIHSKSFKTQKTHSEYEIVVLPNQIAADNGKYHFHRFSSDLTLIETKNKNERHYLCKYRILIRTWTNRNSNELRGLLCNNKRNEIYKGKIRTHTTDCLLIYLSYLEIVRQRFFLLQ